VRLLFLAWVCFSIAFSTVFQAFLTTFLVDPGYKKPIENMDELLASGIFITYLLKYKFLFVNDDVISTHIQSRPMVSAWVHDILAWAVYHKNVSIFVGDLHVEAFFALGYLVGENSEPLLCKLEDGTYYNDGLSMIMSHEDPLLRRVSEIIDRVVEAGLFKYVISLYMNNFKVYGHKIALVNPLDEYYSFKIYHMQTAFYLLLMGWCLSTLCFMVELLYYRFLSKRK
jgi:hypothetical protein